MVLEFKSMNRSWKRFKNAEGDFEDSIQSLNGTAQEEEDFNAIFPHTSTKWLKVTSTNQVISNCFILKTRPMMIATSSSRQLRFINFSYESPEFQIKSGLSKINNSYLESNNREHTKDLNLELPFWSSPIQNLNYEQAPKFQNFMKNLNLWTRFMSEFVINDQFYLHYSGKTEFNWTNVIDKKTYTVTIVDPQVYKGNFMNQVYALSAIRDGNPYVCKYFSSWREEGFIFVQTEKWDKIVAPLILNCQLNAERIVQLIKQVLYGIEYCHKKGLNNLEVSLNSIFISETGHFKLKWFEGCQLNTDTTSSCELKHSIDSKAKDMDMFCWLVEELLCNKHISGEIKKHAKLKEMLQLLVTNNFPFADFDISS